MKITLAQIKTALKDQADRQYLADHFNISNRPTADITDKHVMRYGPLSTQLATSLGVTKQQAYTALNREFKRGNLMKDASPGTICRWWYEGLLDELRPEVMAKI